MRSDTSKLTLSLKIMRLFISRLNLCAPGPTKNLGPIDFYWTQTNKQTDKQSMYIYCPSILVIHVMGSVHWQSMRNKFNPCRKETNNWLIPRFTTHKFWPLNSLLNLKVELTVNSLFLMLSISGRQVVLVWILVLYSPGTILTYGNNQLIN